MPLKVLTAHARQYLLIAIMLLGSALASKALPSTINSMMHGGEHARTLLILSAIVIIFAVGFIVYELAKPTIIPSFVLSILFGLVTHDTLNFVTGNPVILTTIITVGAVLILFGGGLDTPFTKFKNLIGPILSLAFIGTLINAFLLSLVLMSVASATSVALPLPAAVLLGAAIASTDPAAIIPCLQGLNFRQPRVKYIAVSESAINDVVGAVLVIIFLTIFTTDLLPQSVPDAYTMLFSAKNFGLIMRTISLGVLVGIAGFGVLHIWSSWKQEGVQAEEGTDAALFLAVPLFAFTTAEVLGGSGYLAVFLAGLLFHIRVHFRHVEHYFEQTIEGFMKPTIFMLLGAMVEPAQLMAVAPMGITVGLLFMFVMRPLLVLLTLTPFHIWGQRLSWCELAFLSFVRETGVIPAALLITIKLYDIPGSETIIAIGLWVMLLTLIIQPPLTPWLARRLNLVHEEDVLPQRVHNGPVAVLCSRGYSFPERIRTVVKWAQQHSVENIALLHCPEEKYSQAFVTDVQGRAEELFKNYNREFQEEGKKVINFEFLCGPGMLQDNIEKLIAEGDVSIIFVGSKMLDYRLEDVKRLEVPFFFMT